MEYRDQGYAGKSVPAEWLMVLGARGRKGCEKSRPSIDRRGSREETMRDGTARYPCDILRKCFVVAASLEMLI